MPFDDSYNYTEVDRIAGTLGIDVHCYVEIFGNKHDEWYIFTDLERKPKSETEQEDILDSYAWVDKNSFEYETLAENEELEVEVDKYGVDNYFIDGGYLTEDMMAVLPELTREYLHGKTGIVEIIGELVLVYENGEGAMWYDKDGEPESFEWDEYPKFDKQASLKASSVKLKMREIDLSASYNR